MGEHFIRQKAQRFRELSGKAYQDFAAPGLSLQKVASFQTRYPCQALADGTFVLPQLHLGALLYVERSGSEWVVASGNQTVGLVDARSAAELSQLAEREEIPLCFEAVLEHVSVNKVDFQIRCDTPAAQRAERPSLKAGSDDQGN